MNPHMRRIYTLFLGPPGGSGMDRAALRHCGVSQLHCLTSASEALAVLVRQACCVASGSLSELPGNAFVELLVCAGDPEDMSALDFLRRIQVSSSLSFPQILFIAGSETAAEASRCGASAVLLRPYGISELEKALDHLRSGVFMAQSPVLNPRPLRQSAAALSIAPEKTCLQSKVSLTVSDGSPLSSSVGNTPTTGPTAAESVFDRAYAIAAKARARQGKRQSGRSSGEKRPLAIHLPETADAETLLRQALYYDHVDIEASLLLAKIKKQEGDIPAMRRWMHRTGLIYLRMGLKNKAAEIFSRLPENMVGGNPFMQEVYYLLMDDCHEQAAQELIDYYISRENARAEKTDPSGQKTADAVEPEEDAPLHELLARVCMFTPAPEEHMRELCSALERKGRFSTAKKLADRLFIGGCVEREQAEPGFLEAFPRLQELMAVARYTIDAWRVVQR